MKKINFTRHILPHAVAVIVFLVITVFFFNPVFFENKVIDQHDIRISRTSSKSLMEYREQTGEEGLWTPSQFSGMPAYFVHIIWGSQPVGYMERVLSLFLPHPINNIFIAFISYYIMLLAFGVRPYLAIGGAIAFGLSSFMIIGLSAGHNGRIGAMACAPLIVAGVHLVMKGRALLGFGVTSLGMALHMRENHLQITYYLLIIILAYGLVQLVLAAREKQLFSLFKNIGILIIAAILGILTQAGQLWSTAEYTRYSQRGPTELENPKLKGQETGLTRDYAFQYKYGILEPMTLLIPEVYGGNSRSLITDQNNEIYQAIAQNAKSQETANQLLRIATAYWGPQNATIGPYYAGAIVCFLFFIGLFYADTRFFWWLFPLSVFSIMLSWGDSFATFNYFLFDHMPGYNKFRSQNFALFIILFVMPLLGLLGLENLLKRGWNKDNLKKLMWPFGIVAGICLILAVTGGFGELLRDFEKSLDPWFTNPLESQRSDLLSSDAWRSFWFITIFAAAIIARLKNWIKDPVFYLLAGALITADITFVDKRYFTEENFTRKSNFTTYSPTPADLEILRDKSNYRVYNIENRGTSAWSETRTSNFHNSIGGYSTAKLRRYQDLYDSCLSRETQEFFMDAQTGRLRFENYGIMNMLNVKYLLYGPERNNYIQNPEANGNAWFVRTVEKVNTPTQELERVCETNTGQTAVVNIQENTLPEIDYDSSSRIELTQHTPKYLKYESTSQTQSLAVFSEIYYPKGWKATIDGQPADILRANYVLRAMVIPAGTHTIEFRFEPVVYLIGNKITIISCWLLVVIVVASIGMSVKQDLQGDDKKIIKGIQP